VIRFNYNQAERKILVHVIAIIKSTEKFLLKHSSLLLPLIEFVIHDELQSFVQNDLIDMLNRTLQKKRAVHQQLVELRLLSADWNEGKQPDFTKQASGKVKDDYPRRSVAPFFTQLYLIRAMVGTAYSERSPGMKKTGLLASIDFSTQQAKVLTDFYEKSTLWEYLLAFNVACRRSADLADLWYREFYLELSHRIQFPIKMSLPWLLTEDIIENKDQTLVESIFYPIDVYNDAAYRALFILQRRFLYDEIEAEMNLVFDQLVFKLSEQIFRHYKVQASQLLLDTKYRVFMEKLLKQELRSLGEKSRWEIILQQRNINLLGRSVDFNFLLGQRMNINFRENVLKVIQKFESSSLMSILELEGMLENVKMTHSLLSKHMNLDAFSLIMSEVNEGISIVSFESRITSHIIEELLLDLFPAHIYNAYTQRFVKGPPVPGRDDNIEREKPPKIPPIFLYGTKPLGTSYAHLHEQYKSFFGYEHCQAICRLVGRENISLILDTCLLFLEGLVVNDLGPYVSALLSALPPSIKLQAPAYQLVGIYTYFTSLFKDFVSYQELRSGVFAGFRSMGNCLAFLMLLDQSLAQKTLRSTVLSSAFLGITPLLKSSKLKRQNDMDNCVEGESTDMLNYDKFFDFEKLPILQTILMAMSLDPKDKKTRSLEFLKQEYQQAAKAVKLYGPKRDVYSIMKTVLMRFKKTLDMSTNVWQGQNSIERLTKMDSSREFYRLFALLQFIFCLGDKGNIGFSDLEYFGHGFFFGGLAVVYLYGQDKRFLGFNFTDHLLNVDQILELQSKERETIDGFLKNAVRINSLNQWILGLYRAYYLVPPSTQDVFNPPDSDDYSKIKIISTEVGGNNLVQG